MNTSQFFIAIAAATLAVIAILVFVVNENKVDNKFTPLAGLAFACVLGGLFVGDERSLGYILMGSGVILAVVDIVRKWRASNDSGFTQNR